MQKARIKLYEGGGTYWRLYQGALVPASPFPCFPEISKIEAERLLRESKALFLRYTPHRSTEKTEWWYVICDSYDPSKLSSKMRNQIKRGQRNCNVEIIKADWLAVHGYDCYLSAYSRYQNATPVDRCTYEKSIREASDKGLFEYWGVFYKGNLAGYCQCIVEGKQVCTNVIKYDPQYFVSAHSI